MSIELHPGSTPNVPPPPPNWGELAPEGQTALVVRFALADRVVTYPASEFRRWEYVPGENASLLISTAKEQIMIEGRELGVIRAALDLGRLCEVRLNYARVTGARAGPRVQRITIEPA